MRPRGAFGAPRRWLSAWRRWTAEPAVAGCVAVAVLLAAALAQVGWSAARAGTEVADDVAEVERDHRVRAIARLADDALAALRSTVASDGWKGVAPGLEKAAARLEANGIDLSAIAVGPDGGRDGNGERALGSSAAADYRWAVGELRSALAPLLASAAIDAIRVVRRADGRVLLDSTGETLEIGRASCRERREPRGEPRRVAEARQPRG